MNTEDVFCYVLNNLPVNEAVTQNEDGTYSIFLSDSLSPSGKISAFKHAMYHISHDHFSLYLSKDLCIDTPNAVVFSFLFY